MELWSIGIMEYWGIKPDKIPLNPLFQNSSTPIFQLG
jgi:hypothetical protein